jgi:hypothetical protein
MCGEVRNVLRLEILDRRKVTAFEQRDPVIVSADMHPALVGADRGDDIVRVRCRVRRRQVEITRMVAVTVHI